MEPFRRHNSAPMCDLNFAVSLDGGLSQTLFGRSEADATAKNENRRIDSVSGNTVGHPRWSLMKAAQGTVAQLVTSSEVSGPSCNADQVAEDGWTFEDSAGGGFADIDANPMRKCLRQDAQAYLRQIAKLEQQLKAERENGRKLVLAHHEETESLKLQLNKSEEDLRQSKNQCERYKDGYEQVMTTMTDNSQICLALERVKESETMWKKRFEESQTTVRELQGKLGFNGLGDKPTSIKLSYTIKEYEDVSQALSKAKQELEKKDQDFHKSQTNLASNAAKWGQEIKSLKAKADAAATELDLAKRTIDDLKSRLQSEKELFAFQLRKLEKEHVGKHIALISDKEMEGRKVIQQSEHIGRQMIQHYFVVSNEVQ